MWCSPLLQCRVRVGALTRVRVVLPVVLGAAVCLSPIQASARGVSAAGVVIPVSTAFLGSNVTGTIQELSCEVNALVKKGQVCARIDPRPFEQAVAAARANLASATAQLERNVASLAYAKARYQRNLSLMERGIVAKAAFDGIQSTYADAQAQAGLDKAAIDQRKAELATAELNLGYTQVLSPMDGIVLDRRGAAGESVAAHAPPPALFTIASDLTRMHVTTRVGEAEISGLKPGARASVTAKAFPGQAFAGKVEQVRNVPEPGNPAVAYEVVISVDNKDLTLRPGMTALVQIETGAN